jgi:hypothetical protein
MPCLYGTVSRSMRYVQLHERVPARSWQAAMQFTMQQQRTSHVGLQCRWRAGQRGLDLQADVVPGIRKCLSCTQLGALDSLSLSPGYAIRGSCIVETQVRTHEHGCISCICVRASQLVILVNKNSATHDDAQGVEAGQHSVCGGQAAGVVVDARLLAGVEREACTCQQPVSLRVETAWRQRNLPGTTFQIDLSAGSSFVGLRSRWRKVTCGDSGVAQRHHSGCQGDAPQRVEVPQLCICTCSW